MSCNRTPLRILTAYAAEIGRDAATDDGERSINRRRSGHPCEAAGASRSTVRSRYNPTLNYKHYMVPGLLVALVTLIATLVSAQNIAREKELGTLEQLNVTPLTRGQFIAAKLLPFWVLGMLDLGIGLTAGWLIFGIPVRGSLLLLFGSAAVYLVVALAIGLWISTMVETQQQAMFVTFFIMNIYLLMSGLFTPIDSMAAWVQTVSLRQSRTALRHDLARDPRQGRRARRDCAAARVPGGFCRRDARACDPSVLEADGVTDVYLT